ncbi:hypothetical protein Tsubulata_014219 [Turnera subulata]|uniref:Uncharacterized protein n=1 Tax=Turnera subulata TaxID=218843 RepID=A0A9Q0FML5_9ROSI|nr:hypothetical protein Tsubulata_014219 [Turnera subulata]
MIILTKLIAIAIKWRALAGVGRRRISLPRVALCHQQKASKGHFVVYTMDRNRFVIPLVYLDNNIFRELFRMSEEAFGLPRDGPITLACDSAFLEYVLSIVQRNTSKDPVAKAFDVLTSKFKY